MRKAWRPNWLSVGTRSKKLMSSSMVMGRSSLLEHDLFRKPGPTFQDHALRHQLVAARFGDPDGGAGGVLLDLLAQPIDVGLERVGGDARIVAPDFLQQRLARHRSLAGAIEIAQY